MVVFLTLPQLQRVVAQIPAAVRRATITGIHDGARSAVPIMRYHTRRARPASRAGLIGAVATGRYVDEWHAELRGLSATIINRQSYAGVIEGGQPPGEMPPIQNLVRWLAARFGLNAASPATWKIARGVALGIYRRGLRARRVMNGAVHDVADIVQISVVRDITRELMRL